MKHKTSHVLLGVASLVVILSLGQPVLAGTVDLEFVFGLNVPDTRGGIFVDSTYVWIADHKNGLWRADKCDGDPYGDVTGSDDDLWDIYHTGNYIYGASGRRKLYIYDYPARCQFNEGGIRTDLQDGKISIVTGVGEHSNNTMPVMYELSQNIPNPFTEGTTTIYYGLPDESNIRLEIYNLTGQLIRTLVNERQEPGRYTVCWDTKDDAGKIVAPGVYFYCIKAGAYKITKKMVLMR